MSNPVERLRDYCCREWECTPRQINGGMCDEFAFMLQKELASSVVQEFSPETDSEWPTHFWVKHQDNFYDAECCDGVKDWKELPIFRKAVKLRLPPPTEEELVEY